MQSLPHMPRSTAGALSKELRGALQAMDTINRMLELSRVPARGMAVALLSAPIHAYRAMLSPLLPPSCRFAPSCSCYALQALAAHGPFKGSWLALRRLGRCHPFASVGGASGYDPVPDRAAKRASVR